jgi:hypothetical protein
MGHSGSSLSSFQDHSLMTLELLRVPWERRGQKNKVVPKKIVIPVNF